MYNRQRYQMWTGSFHWFFFAIQSPLVLESLFYQVRNFFFALEEQISVIRIHMTSHGHLYLQPVYPRPSSHLWRHKTYMVCTHTISKITISLKTMNILALIFCCILPTFSLVFLESFWWDTCSSIFIDAPFTKVKKWNQHRHDTTDKQNKSVIHMHRRLF